ncbi:hypothetical protein [Saccharothrix sp. HUAS TT1]|uniref:hypothetical protein n=1 Tax=unclassified Saccharothrix TaxID=2593673 RepID=UPI00345BF936
MTVAEARELSARLAAQANELEAMRKGERGGVCFTPGCDDTAKWPPLTSTMEAKESSGKARCDWCRAAIDEVKLPASDGVEYLLVADQWTKVLRMSKDEISSALSKHREAA